MSHEERIGELLEEILDSDRTAEEVCARDPELLGEVCERLRKLRSVEAQIDSLFPLAATETCSAKLALPRTSADPPAIPDYEILSILGRGGMGVVYRARHTKLNRTVALKMLLAGSFASRQERIRFVREAEAAAALRHPNIVQVYDCGEAEGHPYFTMEYIEGGSLDQKLAGASQPALECAQMVAVLAHAVFAAHQSGIIHRDLKPANIVLAEDNTPKISDFGLARRLDGDGGLTQTGAKIGTPNYMAPEQMTGNSPAGPSVDIFALGAILYEMLTGRPPFRGASLSETERKLTTEDPVPPSRMNARVPRDLETICLKCLEKDPQRRYATAADLAADLDRFLRHEPIRARPISPGERVVRWVRRKPLVAALAVSAAIVVGLVIGEAIRASVLAAGRRSEKARLTARFESGVQLVQEGRLAEAQAILGKLGDGGHEDLRQRIDRTLAHLALVEELDAIGVNRAFAAQGMTDSRDAMDAAVKRYAASFTQGGLGDASDDPEIVAKRIQDSDVRGALVNALDDWAVCESNETRRKWLLDVARRAEPNPSRWFDQVRDPATWRDPTVLAQLAKTASQVNASVQLLRTLGDRLTIAGRDSIAFRKEVQQEHTDNFLANLTLADALRGSDPTESIRYYQAALAIRPQAAPARNNLALALAALGKNDEAISHYTQAIKLAPDSGIAHYNLGLTLVATGKPDDAIVHFQQAIKLTPKLALAHGTLGETLFKKKRYAEAEAALRQCLALLLEDDPARSKVTELLQHCKTLRTSGE